MSDRAIRQAVIDELAFDPRLDTAHIGVEVDSGIVTLTGHVGSAAERAIADGIVGTVRGVRGVVEQLKVRLGETQRPRDAELAHRAVQILDWHVMLPPQAIRVKAKDGWLTLTGTVPWQFQKGEAASALVRLPGLLGLINLIEVVPSAADADLRTAIEAALRRSAQIDADGIGLRIEGGCVILTGQVRAWNDRAVAERTAWAAPGVRAVRNLIEAG